MPPPSSPRPQAAKLTHLPAGTGVVMPWKNGGGSTTELAIRPSGSKLSASVPFDWRLSIATIAADGPFSALKGYERTILQLNGPLLTLVHGGPKSGTEGSTSRLLTLGSPWLFGGETATSASKASPQSGGEPAHDFNVMVRRNYGAAHIWDLTSAYFFARGNQWSTASRASTIATYVSSGSAEVTVGDQKMSLAEGALAIWEFAALQSGVSLKVTSNDSSTRVIAIEINAKP